MPKLEIKSLMCSKDAGIIFTKSSFCVGEVPSAMSAMIDSRSTSYSGSSASSNKMFIGKFSIDCGESHLLELMNF